MAAEAGEDELPGLGVPVEVDGHAGARVEAVPEGYVQREEPIHALIGGAVVGGVPDLGVLADIAAEVTEAGLLTQELVRLEVVGRVGLEFRKRDQACKITIQGAFVLEDTLGGFGQRLRQHDDMFSELGLRHVLGQHFVGRAIGLSRLRRR